MVGVIEKLSSETHSLVLGCMKEKYTVRKLVDNDGRPMAVVVGPFGRYVIKHDGSSYSEQNDLVVYVAKACANLKVVGHVCNHKDAEQLRAGFLYVYPMQPPHDPTKYNWLDHNR